jgi:hypothetical protein
MGLGRAISLVRGLLLNQHSMTLFVLILRFKLTSGSGAAGSIYA